VGRVENQEKPRRWPWASNQLAKTPI